MSIEDADRLLCAALRGGDALWPSESRDKFSQCVLDRAAYHGVQALIHDIYRDTWNWPSSVRTALRSRSVGQAMYELRHQALLTRLLMKLREHGVTLLFIKGTALAYDVYKDPALRSRGDTDVFISEKQLEAFERVAADVGFKRSSMMSANVISNQASYSLQADDGTTHDLDVHWKINNAPILANLLSFDELLARSTLIDRLHPLARAPSHVDAIILACVHRATHVTIPYYVNGTAYYGADRLIWLYDIDLLARTLTHDQWCALTSSVSEKRLSTICGEALSEAQVKLATPVPRDVMDALFNSVAQEPISMYLKSGASKKLWLDFGALGTTRARLSYVKETLLPQPDYMKQKYSSALFQWLPWLYVRRAATGLLKTFSRARTKA